MSQTRRTTRTNVRKPRQSLKSLMGKIAIAITSCVNHSEDSKVSFKVKKQDKKCASLRNPKPSSLSPNAVLHGDVKSASTTSQHPHISSNGPEHERCPTTKENSSSNVVTKQADALNSLLLIRSSLQIESPLQEQTQGSDVDNVNDSSQGQNQGTAPAVMESDAGASSAPSLNTTLSTISSINECIKTNSGRNYQETSKRSSSSGSEHVDTTTSFSNTTAPRENRISSHLYSNEPTDGNLTSESLTLPTPLNQSAIETVPQSGSLSYENLGIITAHPEKPEFAFEDKRRKSFEGWPPEHYLKPDDLAKAGFYYSGYSDAARCFYCSGGLRLWEEGDDVWVEHARWFPQCEFLRQSIGCAFIDAVQELKKEQNVITYEDVLTKVETQGLKDSIPKDAKKKTSELDQNTAVKAMLDAGFPRDKVLKAARRLQQNDQTVAGDLLYEEMYKQENTKSTDATENVNDMANVQDTEIVKEDQETYESLKKEIAELRQIGLCKICMDKKVSVVFLPCGHLISCQDCSYALKSCPICRDSIKGIVRAYLS